MVARPVAWKPQIDWRSLSYHHAPDPALASQQHAALVARLRRAGAEIVELDVAGLSADAVYVHDASFPTDRGVIILQMGKQARRQEPERHRQLLSELGVPVLGIIEGEGRVEAGDLVWLDPETLLVGLGFRTNRAGAGQLRRLLPAVDIIEVHLPYGPGPSECLHLMSLMSVLDAQTVLVDRSWLTVVAVQLLEQRGMRLVEIDPAERDSFGCNVLALGAGRVLALEQNPNTNAAIAAAGLEVWTFDGSEIALNGGGGPTCLTRPLQRGR